MGVIFTSPTVARSFLIPQQSATAPPADTQEKPTATPDKPAAEQKDAPDQVAPAKTPVQKTAPSATKTAKKPATKKKKAAPARTAKKRRRPMSPRVRRIREAFVASTSLRPMAQQLIQDRSPAAYAGVEAFARAHAKEDAGALAWLAVGYAHVIDHDYAKAIDPLNRAKPRAGDLGDYVAYYLGTCYLQTGRQGEALGALADFEKTYPDSLLARDAGLSYAGALLTEGRAAEAAELLEKDRLPVRSDVEFTLGKAYATLHQNAKAAEALANIYFNIPSAAEADSAYALLKTLDGVPPVTFALRKTRADLLMKARRYSDAVDEYRELLIHSGVENRATLELALADALHRSGRNREARAELTTLTGATPDQSAQRLYILGEVAWASDENETFYRTV
ncbi:MAG TPA: hypothetical protein VGJ09_14090, partial [Bryobacteraceae bacterium]